MSCQRTFVADSCFSFPFLRLYLAYQSMYIHLTVSLFKSLKKKICGTFNQAIFLLIDFLSSFKISLQYVLDHAVKSLYCMDLCTVNLIEGFIDIIHRSMQRINFRVIINIILLSPFIQYASYTLTHSYIKPYQMRSIYHLIILNLYTLSALVLNLCEMYSMSG